MHPLTITNSAATIDLSKYNVFSNTSNVISNATGSATSDFVFGSNSLDDIGSSGYSRIFFDKSSGAFRTGKVLGGEGRSRLQFYCTR